MPSRAILEILIPIWVLSEIVLGVVRRARRESDKVTDRRSSVLLWGVICVSVSLAVAFRTVDWGRVPLPPIYLDRIALVLLLSGVLLRWWAILTLGQFFTMNLAVRSEHEVVSSGPYRWVRHPAYTGLLLAFGGCGCYFGNWVSLGAYTLPITLAVLYRIRVEEKALVEELGVEYERYRQDKKRLLPWVY